MVRPALNGVKGLGGPALARVGKNALALLIAQAGVRAFNLLLIAWLTRTAGVEALGRYLLAITVEAVALAIVDLGLNIFTVRALSQEPWQECGEILRFAQNDSGRVAQNDSGEGLWGTVLGLKLLSALAGVILLNVLIAPFFFQRGQDLAPGQGLAGGRWMAIAIVSLALPADAFNDLAVALVKARQRMEISSGMTLGLRFLSALVGALLAWLGYGERALLIVYVLASWGGSAIWGAILRSWGVRFRCTGLRRRWRAVLGEAMPFAITGIVAMLYTRLGLLMLSFWQGDMAAGLYGAVHRLWEALGMIPSSFLDALFPEMSRLVSSETGSGGTRTGGACAGQILGDASSQRFAPQNGNGWARVQAFYRRGRRLMWAIVAALVVPSLLAAPWMLALLYGRTVGTGIEVMPIASMQAPVLLLRVLLLATPFTYLYLLNGHALYAVGQQRRVTVTMVAVTALSGLLNALVAPRWSYWGVVGVTWVTEVTLFVLFQALVRRYVLRPRLAL